MESERLPPHDRDAERSLLGAVFRYNELLGDVLPIVGADDFYAYAHQLLFAAIVAIVESGRPADPVTLADYLHERKQTTDVGGNGYLVDLWDAAPVVGNAKHYAKIIRRCATLRSIIHLAGELQEDAYDRTANPDEMVAKAEEAVFRLSTRGVAAGRLLPWKQVLADCQARINRRARADGEDHGEALSTGWRLFDRMTGGGIFRGELTVVAARPSVGKTMFALWLLNTICREGHRALFASIEQGALDIGDRMLAQLSGVSSRAFRGGMTAMEAEKVVGKAAEAAGYQLHIDDSPRQSVASIASHARRLKARSGLDAIVVDYLGLINSTRHRGMSRAEEVGLLVHGLNELKRELGVAVILLAQLNRGVDGQPSGKPRLSNLRESGDIEQDADTVILLHKPDDHDDERPTDALDVIVAKQRNGPCGTVHMVHEKANFRVYELETN